MVLTFLVAAYFSYVTGDTVRAGYLLAVGLALTWDQVHRRAIMRRWLLPAVLAALAYSVVAHVDDRHPPMASELDPR